MSETSEHIEILQMESNTSAGDQENQMQDVKKEVMKKHEELIRLSEDGEISQSVQNLKKASNKVILKIYAEYEVKQAEKANVFLTDFLISKFSDLLGGFEAIESSEELEKELSKDKLLKRDLKSVVEQLSPYLPYFGILSGGITVGKHFIKKRTDKKQTKEDRCKQSTS